MPSFLKNLWEQFRAYWTDRTTSQRILIAGLAISVTIAFALMIYWLNRPDYRVLYTKLYPEDASKVVSMLQASKEPYKLENNGQTILVPVDRVYDLRLKIAGEGSLHGQGIGFEIFDDIQIGQTDFVQHINYQRALQGELARTVSEFPQIERARVHLVIPHKSLFIEDQMDPSASVILMLKAGEKLDEKQVNGIVNLITMAVEGLDKSHITVTDMKGQPLYHPDEDETTMGMSTTQLEYKAQMERTLERRIMELLGPVVGPEKVIARINADLDFSQKTTRKETFDPDGSVVRSETRSEESTQGRANVDGGVPEPNFRGDGFTGSLSTQDSARESRTTNFEINKEEQNIISPVGELQRLSVAVIVDGMYELAAEGAGEYVYTPRTEEELNRIRNLVRNAIGYDEVRGDTLEVSNIAFGEPEPLDSQGLMRTIAEYVQRLGKPFLNGLLIFLFLILVVRPVVMALIKPRVAEQEMEEVAGLPGAERLALEEEDVDEEALDTSRRLENAKSQAAQLAEQNMDQAVRLLKTWLKQEAA